MVQAALRIGTRASQLAITQTGWVADLLRAAGADVELVQITTRGDVRQDAPVSGIGSDGVFVRELERALLEGRIDLAVHSLKDLPTAGTPGLELAAVPTRVLPFDVLVGGPGVTLEGLRPGAVVGTSSVRRVAQVLARRRDLVVRPLRGNVDTRLRRLDAGDYDALVLAGAGLERLGLSARITQVLEPPLFWPAVGQGALAVQIRATDRRTAAAVATLDDPLTHDAVRAERACLQALAGGCLAPIGCWARHDSRGRLALGACVLEIVPQGVERLVVDSGELAAAGAALAVGDDEIPPERLGIRAAESLLARGAAGMLDRMRAHATQPTDPSLPIAPAAGGADEAVRG